MIGFGQHHLQHRLVDRHFAGRGTPTRDGRMFQHLRSCAPCRERYRTYATLEAMTAEGDDQARARLQRGVFPAARRRLWVGAGLGMAVACAAVLTLVLRPADDGFRARGGGAGTSEGAHRPTLAIFRVAADGVTRTQRAGGQIRSGEPLAFSFTNPGDYARLMVFAVDDGGRVFWFWPAWTNPADDPSSIIISPGSEPMELGESVRHPLRPGHVTIYGLFSPADHRVREVEAALARGGPAGLKALDGVLWSQTLDVTP